jgi:hypothetical protein
MCVVDSMQRCSLAINLLEPPGSADLHLKVPGAHDRLHDGLFCLRGVVPLVLLHQWGLSGVQWVSVIHPHLVLLYNVAEVPHCLLPLLQLHQQLMQ